MTREEKKDYAEVVRLLLKLLVKAIVVLFMLWAIWECYFWYQISYKPYRGKKFDSTEWLCIDKEMAGFNGKCPIECTRECEKLTGWDKCSMYTDLVTNYLKPGMKLEEVQKLIGGFGPIYCMDKKIKCLSYSLGTIYLWNLFRVDSCWLSICFNNKHELVSVSKKGYDYYGEVCNYRFMSCLHDDKPCNCYLRKEQTSPGKCPTELERW